MYFRDPRVDYYNNNIIAGRRGWKERKREIVYLKILYPRENKHVVYLLILDRGSGVDSILFLIKWHAIFKCYFDVCRGIILSQIEFTLRNIAINNTIKFKYYNNNNTLSSFFATVSIFNFNVGYNNIIIKQSLARTV